VDDTLTNFDLNKTSQDTFHNIMNNTDGQLEFKLSREDKKTINNLDLLNRKGNNVDLNT
jgi:hypothetical protein